jgi:hypothetical protein
MRDRLLAIAAALPIAASPALAQGGASAPQAVKLGGYLQARETYQDGIGLTASINRARLTASGSVSGGVAWRVQGEFRTGNVGTGKASVALQDALPAGAGRFGVQFGQFKAPFTRGAGRARRVGTADRSTVVDSLAPADIRVAATACRRRATVAVGLFNRNGRNVTSSPDSALLGVARRPGGRFRSWCTESMGPRTSRRHRYRADQRQAPW